MDRKMKSNDIFSYVRFEASGDSEVDNNCDDFNMNMDWEIERPLVYDDNDDALSCSYDDSASAAADDDDDHDQSYDEHHDDDEERDVVGYGTSYCEEDDDDEVNNDQQYDEKRKKKSYVCNFDSDGRESSMDEMEKNRLFWEACLAS
ncbi:hypothetical protein QL285_004556 [Trifolium repens]|nr:hypothetical protein QL285_004556 [Trifolium repens]